MVLLVSSSDRILEHYIEYLKYSYSVELGRIFSSDQLLFFTSTQMSIENASSSRIGPIQPNKKTPL